MSNLHSVFLKEMGITEWSTRQNLDSSPAASPISEQKTDTLGAQDSIETLSPLPARYQWWFFGELPQGGAGTLFQGIVRALGLAQSEWIWVKPGDVLQTLAANTQDLPKVAVSFGALTTQQITGEREPLSQLRETVLALSGDASDDVPVVATFDLAHLIGKPQDKALLWQDLLLARSVL